MEDNHLGSNGLSPKQNSEHQKDELKSQDIDCGSTECRPIGSHAKIANPSAEDIGSIRSNSGKAEIQKASTKNSRRLSHYGKKVATKLRSRKYNLRSSLDGTRVLRSMSKGASKTPTESSNNLVNPVKEKQKRTRKVKGALNDEFLRTKKRVRYLLTRMDYEQNLIDAYSGEGWKGQSLEKIKPEKELQRAKSEIIRCKLKIRDLFQHLDSSISEGRLDDSLFDSEGEICGEDIFCAKCRSKDLSADNDIILCDGICDRGFHQKCLNPPMLSENIPTGDEGWLCPGCDCKVDCIDLLNEFQGTNISIEDKWEKVFPEAAGDKHCDDGLPSDDFEDGDYNPDGLEVDDELNKGSSSEDSDFTSSEDSGASKHATHDVNFGLPSDDSEDNDFDPDKPDLDENIQKDNSSSDQSDFTSDTDDLDFLSNNNLGANVTAVSPVSTCSMPLAGPSERSGTRGRSRSSVNSELSFLMESDLGQEDAILVSGKRHREHLDYKKLHDEAYGNTSSDSSDDEDWAEMSTPKKVKNDPVGKDRSRLTMERARTSENQRTSKRSEGRLPEDITAPNEQIGRVSAQVNENSLKKKNSGKLQSEVVNHSVAKMNKDIPDSDSNGNVTASSSKKHFGSDVLKKLQDYFKENKYPSRDAKESMVNELGITVQQVSKWFENARRSFRVSAKEASPAGFGFGNSTILSETSRSIKPQKATGSERSAGEGSRVKQLCKSHNIEVSTAKHDSGIKSNKVTGSERSAGEGSQVKQLCKSNNIEMPMARHHSGNQVRKKEVTGENTDRQKLILRELRKRRKSM